MGLRGRPPDRERDGLDLAPRFARGPYRDRLSVRKMSAAQAGRMELSAYASDKYVST